jgi:uncharacterized protein (UPF0335 family)
MSDNSIPGGRIRSFVERIEHLDTELQELNESKKEVFSEAKAEGFDVKILKEIIKLRKQDKDERDERDTLLDMYMRAMETAGPELAGQGRLTQSKSRLGSSAFRRTGGRDNPVTPYFLAQRWSELVSHSAANAVAQLKS